MLTNDEARRYLEAALVKVEPEIIRPLAKYTWTRDLPSGNDLDRTVEAIALTRITHGSGQGTSEVGGRSWIAKGANDLKGVDYDTTAEAIRVFTAGREAAWTGMELERAAKFGVKVDTERVEIINDIFQQEAQAVGYLGDEGNGIKGLLNHTSVETITGSGLLAASKVDTAKLMQAFDNAMRAAEENAGDNVVPSMLLVCPADFVLLHSIKVDTGNTNVVSMIEYIEKYSYGAVSRGGMKVEKVKELKGIGGSQKNRMLFYTPETQYLKYNVLPIWREKTYDKGLQYCAAYVWRIAEVQLRHPETLLYVDGI